MINKEETYKLLLEFLKMVADESVYEKFDNLNELSWEASILLNKIREDE